MEIDVFIIDHCNLNDIVGFIAQGLGVYSTWKYENNYFTEEGVVVVAKFMSIGIMSTSWSLMTRMIGL